MLRFIYHIKSEYKMTLIFLKKKSKLIYAFMDDLLTQEVDTRYQYLKLSFFGRYGKNENLRV